MIATVEDDTLIHLEADRDHPISGGFVCNKGIYGFDIHNDPDRLRVPLKQTAPGTFEEISWDVALTEISEKILDIKERYGDSAIAGYAGNPGAFNTLLGPSYGSFMVQIESVPGVFSSALGDIGYIFRSKSLDEIFEIVQFVHKTD